MTAILRGVEKTNHLQDRSNLILAN